MPRWRSARPRRAATTSRAAAASRTAIRRRASPGCSRSRSRPFASTPGRSIRTRRDPTSRRRSRCAGRASGSANLDRFGDSLDDWFGREETPLWLTEYGHETRPDDPVGIDPALQAEFAADALELAAENTRVRALVWFILRDTPGTNWQSGVVAEDGTRKPAFAAFAEAARRLDARNPVLPADADVARVPALEIAFYTPAGDPISVSLGNGEDVSVPLGEDGWIDVPLAGDLRRSILLEATDAGGRTVERRVEPLPEPTDVAG